ncbi:hypothetical protein ACFV4T_08860 [Streptomyces sp. NPDC059755]|uniref:hypothetical protein n=1 Tax=Streptomyces sp. NPDC059755 TaxID=3346934 RepID=UPI0036685EEA
MPASERAAVLAARQVSGGAETSARGEKDDESEGRAGGRERRAGQGLLGEASSEGGAGELPGADREGQSRVRLAGAAFGGEVPPRRRATYGQPSTAL